MGPKKGLAVHFGHEDWNMVLSMMIGIRMSVGCAKHEMTREITPVDFLVKEKLSIIPQLANIFDSEVSKHISMTRFYDYAPMVFQRIRSAYGIHPDAYLRSLGPEQLLGNMVLGNLSSLSELSSEGKSGAYFYHTADGRFLLKTVTPQGFRLLRRMLKEYYYYMVQHPASLISRFLGLHCLRARKTVTGARSRAESLMKPIPCLYFIVMGNMFHTPLEIHRRYDLKGAWVGRETPVCIRDPTVALKDVDFRRANECIQVGAERRAKLVAQVELDTAFLRDNNVIDYSLLVGIHDAGCDFIVTAGEEEDSASDGGVALPCNISACSTADTTTPHVAKDVARPRAAAEAIERPVHKEMMGGMLSSDRKTLYFIGIIDILTTYGTTKKLEHHFRSLKHDHRGISCCPPVFYAERFNDFFRRACI